MSSVDPSIQAKASSLIQGYSPSIHAGTADKTGMAKAGQVVKNLKGKVSAQITRLMIRVNTGEKVTNESIIDKVKKLDNETFSEGMSDVVKLKHSLQTVQVSRTAWKELQCHMNEEDANQRDPFINKEVQIRSLMKSEVNKQSEKLENSLLQLSENPYLDPDKIEPFYREIQTPLAATPDISLRKDILKNNLEPFKKANDDYYAAKRTIDELSSLKDLSSAEKRRLDVIKQDFSPIETKFKEFEKLEAAENSPLEKLRDELVYTEMLLKMQTDFDKFTRDSDASIPVKPQMPRAQPIAQPQPIAEGPAGQPVHPLEVKGDVAAPVASAEPQPENGNPLEQNNNQAAAENTAPPAASPKSSIATRERELIAQQEQLKTEKEALKTEKQEVRAAKQDIEARELKLKEEQEKLEADRKLIQDQAKLEADKRIQEYNKLQDKYVKDTTDHLEKEFNALAKLDSNYSEYSSHGREGGSHQKKYLDADVFRNFEGLKSSHDAFQKSLQSRTVALHSRTRDFMEKNPGKLNELEEVQGYKIEAEQYLHSQKDFIAHTGNAIKGRATSPPEKNPFAEFVLWQSESDKNSDLAKLLSERLAESGSLSHQLLVAETADGQLKAEVDQQSALRGGNRLEDLEALEFYKRQFIPPLPTPPPVAQVVANPPPEAP